MMNVVSQLLQGILQGGQYALLAIGLSLSIGVVRLVNLAHGDMVVLAAYCIVTLASGFGLHPLVALLLTIPISAAAALVMQVLLFQRVAGGKVSSALLLTFGLSVVTQNLLLQLKGADAQRLSFGGIDMLSITPLPGISLGVLPLLAFGAAITLVLVLDLVLYRTNLGAHIRAVAENVESADLIGLSSAKVSAITMAIIGVTIAISGFFLSITTSFYPTTGPSQLLFAFQAVILGGLGSLWGTLAGGVILGVAQAIGGQIDVSSQLLFGHVAFLAVLLLKPAGIFSRGDAA